MKDLNFFESYNKKREKTFNKDFILYAAIGLLIFSILSYAIINYIEIKKLRADVLVLEKEVEYKNKDKKIKEILDKEKDINELKLKIDNLNNLDDYVTKNDIINETLLYEINKSIPDTIFLNSMVINTNAIKIEAKSKDKKSIAQFEHNLNEINDFEEIFIPQIISYENYYGFTIDIKLKEENIDGVEAEK